MHAILILLYQVMFRHIQFVRVIVVPVKDVGHLIATEQGAAVTITIMGVSAMHVQALTLSGLIQEFFRVGVTILLQTVIISVTVLQSDV